MQAFKILGGRKLKGEVKPQGAKNEALQIICATLLTPEEVVINNIPDIIDINMGCPVKKVVNGYAGSALMRDETLALSIIKSVVNSVDIPVTLK